MIIDYQIYYNQIIIRDNKLKYFKIFLKKLITLFRLMSGAI